MTYLGARSLLAPSQAFVLGAGWAYQPKLDGCYAVATTDDAGRIASVVSRNGLPLDEGRDLLGILAAPPRSALVGELEASTEAGNAAAAARGYRALHLFDCLALDGTDLRDLPYRERWGALHRGQSMLEADGAARVRSWREVPHERHVATARPINGRPLSKRAVHAHDPVTGRTVARIPRDLRRLPVVPLLHEADARELWRDVEAGTLEGLVAVRLDATAGARGSKLKIKITDTLDVRVLASDRGALRVATRAGSTQQAWRTRPTFTLGSHGQERPGTVLEVAHHGWYKSGEPRFARVVRRRTDIG